MTFQGLGPLEWAWMVIGLVILDERLYTLVSGSVSVYAEVTIDCPG